MIAVPSDAVVPTHPEPDRGTILLPIERRGAIVAAAEVAVQATTPADDAVLRLAAAACAVIVDGAQLRRRAVDAEKRLAAVSERERIARDVHERVTERIDTLAEHVATLLVRTRESLWRRRLEELLTLSYEADRDVREAAHALLFLEARRRELAASLSALAVRFELTTGVSCAVTVAGTPVSVGGSRSEALFRVAHEALLDIDRHARAAVVSMCLTFGEASVTLVVRDDGVGRCHRDPFGSSRPGGPRAMHQLVEPVGGTVRVAAGNPRGVVVEASVPLPRRRAATAARR